MIILIDNIQIDYVELTAIDDSQPCFTRHKYIVNYSIKTLERGIISTDNKISICKNELKGILDLQYDDHNDFKNIIHNLDSVIKCIEDVIKEQLKQ